MLNYKTIQLTWMLLFIASIHGIKAQLSPNVYQSVDKGGNNPVVYQLTIDDVYAILSVYKTSPPEFVKTLGGYYNIKNGALVIQLEFNTNFASDSRTQLNIPFSKKKNGLQLSLDGKKAFKAVPKVKQDLDGKWLFASRIADSDKSKRDSTNPRKTLKFLLDGHFQWIAYNTETYEFFGTGGGTFTAKDGRYEETIEFFSKDNSRVGQKLGFTYELRGNDWYQTGKSSKGDPLGEIWTRRQ